MTFHSLFFILVIHIPAKPFILLVSKRIAGPRVRILRIYAACFMYRAIIAGDSALQSACPVSEIIVSLTGLLRENSSPCRDGLQLLRGIISLSIVRDDF